MDAPKYLLSEDEMLDYHEGQDFAYSYNLSRHDYDCSFWKLKGYFKVIRSLTEILEEDLNSEESFGKITNEEFK